MPLCVLSVEVSVKRAVLAACYATVSLSNGRDRLGRNRSQMNVELKVSNNVMQVMSV